MKKAVVLLIFALTSMSGISQSMDHFFKYVGVRVMATMAHPTNTFKYGEYRVSSNNIWMKIYYENDYVTELEVRRYGNFFGSVRVIYDNDWAVPFAGIELMKDIILELIEDDGDQRNVSEFERLIGRGIAQMSGTDLGCLALTLSWLDY